MKGVTMSEKKSKSKRVKMTLLLDSDSIKILKRYGEKQLNISSVSAIVRAIAKEYERKEKAGEW